MDDVQKDKVRLSEFRQGFRDSLALGIGYLSVGFAFGVMAIDDGGGCFNIGSTVLMSLTNLTSAGQIAGVGLIAVGAPIIEIVLMQIIINIRYSLMSMSISQKSDSSMTNLHRVIIGFFITDEIFALAVNREKVNKMYMYGLAIIPISSWILGTFLGALAGKLLPESVIDALSMAVYGMFIAIIIPPTRQSHAIRVCVMFSIILSCILRFTPYIKENLSPGLAIMICAIVVSALCAKLFPVEESGENE